MIFDKSFSSIPRNAPCIVCEENHQKYVANNPRRSIVYQFRIDGVIITDMTQKRCDYLVENETTRHVYLVELKGSDLGAAFMQINSTIDYLSVELNSYTLHARIVCAKVSAPRVNDSRYRQLKRNCSDIRYHSRHLEETI